MDQKVFQSNQDTGQPGGNETQDSNMRGKDSKRVVKKEGRVQEALPNAFFRILLDDGKEVMGFLSGKMRINNIKIMPGDKVTIEMTQYDDKKGRIVYRLK